MILLLLFVLSLIGVSDGNVCCMPMPQWEGIQDIFSGYVMDGKTYTETGTTKIVFDAINIRIYAKVDLDNHGTPVKQDVIQNFKLGVQYIITNNVCHKAPLQVWKAACLPDEAQLVQNANMGFGATLFPTTTYNVSVNGTLAYVVMASNCTPIGQTVNGVSGGIPYVTTTNFFNITSGIRDPSVFNPPAICNNVMVNTTHVPDTPHVKARRSFQYFN